MKKSLHPVRILCGLFLACFLVACSKPPEGKVIVTESEFFIRQDTPHSWSIDARGKIRNVGDVDVRRVVVTGYCRSCGEILTPGAWFISDIEKRTDQKAVVNYLPAGAEEGFTFREVAFLMDTTGTNPAGMPEKLEIEIVSFETVAK